MEKSLIPWLYWWKSNRFMLILGQKVGVNQAKNLKRPKSPRQKRMTSPKSPNLPNRLHPRERWVNLRPPSPLFSRQKNTRLQRCPRPFQKRLVIKTMKIPKRPMKIPKRLRPKVTEKSLRGSRPAWPLSGGRLSPLLLLCGLRLHQLSKSQQIRFHHYLSSTALGSVWPDENFKIRPVFHCSNLPYYLVQNTILTVFLEFWKIVMYLQGHGLYLVSKK